MVRMVLALILFGCAGRAAADSEETAVVAVVQRLFKAMAAHDVASARGVLLPEGHYASVREGGAVSSGSHAEFLARLAASKEAWLERIWEPQVRVHGRIASVWAPYDFHRAGKFSHCGVDSFSLVKAAEGWRIAGFWYTVETSGCAASPLGPPK